ncbi:MAG: CDP-diacylglycerol--serine O-phosphatidyltransferase [Alphaproteobacteria bacterium]
MIDLAKPRRTPRDLPLTRLLPNMLTLMSLCSGLTAMRFAMQDKWEAAALAIVIAGVFDMLDGRVARLLNIVSKFGAELDSLSDVISFGVAPGFVIYEWAMKDASRLGWIAVLVYAVCAALRLARFNTMLEDKTAPAWTKSYFNGVPAPGGAGLAILPLVYVLEFGPEAQISPTLVSLWMILIGALMVSRVPTFALKGWRIPRSWLAPIMAVAVLLLAGVITDPWVTLGGIGTVYFLSIPCAFVVYKMRERREGSVNA